MPTPTNELPDFGRVVRVKTICHDRVAAYRVQIGDEWEWQTVNFEIRIGADQIVSWNPVDGELRDTIKSGNIICVRSGAKNIPIVKGNTSCQN